MLGVVNCLLYEVFAIVQDQSWCPLYRIAWCPLLRGVVKSMEIQSGHSELYISNVFAVEGWLLSWVPLLSCLHQILRFATH